MHLYWIIFLGTLSTVVVPLPEEATLLAAGYAARLGRVTLPGAILAALAAVVIGDSTSYFVGRLFLAPLLRTRIGRKLVPQKWLLWGERLARGHAVRATIVARFLVGLRGFVYFAVGASRFAFATFLAVDAAIGLLEVSALVALGFGCGELRADVGRRVDLVVGGLLVLALFAPLVIRRWIARAPQREDSGM